MAYVMLQYDRPTDARQWHEYNGRIRNWIVQLLALPGAVSFMAYRSADGSSPNTTTMLEFGTLDQARDATASEQMKSVLQGLRAMGATPRVLIVERSPFTPSRCDREQARGSKASSTKAAAAWCRKPLGINR